MTIDREKRVSKVFRIWDWPRGVRSRGWGLLVDQIWFYDEPSEFVPISVTNYLPPGFSRLRDEIEPFQSADGKWWRREDGRWMRLYMHRRMLWLPRWLGNLRIRVHTFHSGDDDSAPHDHPWAFVTFPLRAYTETVEEEENSLFGLLERRYRRVTRVVRRLRFHLRPAEYRHFVHEPERPFTTIVFARDADPPRKWGFWPDASTFVPFDVWTRYEP